MTLILPVAHANTRYIWSVSGLVDPFGFSIATHGHGLSTPIEIAQSMSLAWTGGTIGSAAQWNDEFTYMGVQTTVMTVSGPIVVNYNVGMQGTNAGDASPVNCSILVSKLTELGGRKNRGRFNIPSGKVEEGNINAAGFIESSVYASLQNQANEFFDDIVATTFVPCLLHSHPDDAPTDITAFAVSSQLSTQRRRMR